MTFTTTPRRLAKTFALVAGMSVLSMHAFAGGDAALYGPTAPKGSTFVRIYNASNAEVSATVAATEMSISPAMMTSAITSAIKAFSL